MKKVFAFMMLSIAVQVSYAQDTLLLKTGQKVIGKLENINDSSVFIKVGSTVSTYKRNEIKAFYLRTTIQLRNGKVVGIVHDADKKASKIAAEFSETGNPNKKVMVAPNVRENTEEYIGTYEMPEYTQFVLSKTVSGIWQGDFNTFQKGEYRHAARFENIKIEGAWFTGILPYENGKAENFLMVFVERLF